VRTPAETPEPETTTQVDFRPDHPAADGDAQVDLAGGSMLGRARDSSPSLVDVTINDRYIVNAILGRGGMGTVYLARDRQLERDVALKLHRAGTGNDRLHREALAMAKLAHPNVVTVYEVGTAADRLYVAMEYVRGGTLRSWLTARSRSWREIVALLIEAGAGLAAAHAVGLVHRDFKPENVLVGEDGRPHVTDFGLARLGPATGEQPTPPELAAALDNSMTKTGTVLGTPAYMAPEQFEGHVDARSDQFAFCVVLWESLFAQRPFAGNSLAEIHAAIERSEIQRPRRHEVPERLRRVIERGFAVDPAARFPDMPALLAAVRGASASRLRKQLAIGAAAAVVLGGGAALALGLRGDGRGAMCEAEEARVRALFGPSERAALQTAFAASKSPLADNSFQRAAAVFERQATALATQRAALCRGTDESHRVVLARRQCLAEREQQMMATLEVFAKPDAKLVARAPDIVWGMYEPEPCVDPPPVTPSVSQSPELARQLARARVAERTGHYDEGVQIAEPIVRDARAKGDRGTELQAVLLLGQLTQRSDRNQEGAQKWLHDAIAIAEAQGRDIDAASALSSLANLAAVDKHDYTNAHRYIDLARAKLARIGHGNTAAQAVLMVTETQVLVDEVRFIEAEKTIRRAVELMEEAYGPDHPKFASTLAVMSQVLRGANKNAEALGPARRAVGIFAAAYGEEHPYVAGGRMNLATSLIDAEQYGEAREQLVKADATFAKLYGKYHRYRAAIGGNLGELEMQEKHYDAALAAFQHALDVIEHELGPESAEAAGVHRDVARALVAQGKLAEALVHSQRDVAILDRSGKDNPRLPTAQCQLAEIELALGHPAVAAPAAERGLVLAEAQGDDAEPGELARLRFSLARGLWDTGGDRVRARKLAEQSEAFQPDAERKSAVTQWLASHRP